MIPSSLPDDIRDLSVPDRIELVTAIWNSVEEDTSVDPLSEAQKRDLDRRLASREVEPDAWESWESVKKRLFPRL